MPVVIEKSVVESLLRRAHRHIVALGESDADAGHRDASLVRLCRDWHAAGVWGGATLDDLADRIDRARVRKVEPCP